MKVACLQFAPRLGAVASNIKAANALLAERDLTGVDLLVLPELALSGTSSWWHQQVIGRPDGSLPSSLWLLHRWHRTSALIQFSLP